MDPVLAQPDNPSNEERYEILKYMLARYNRTEDFPNIIRGTSPPTPITQLGVPGSLNGVRIGVIGAGVSGLSAAYELRKMGAEIDIIEALDNHIGGKCYTYFFDEDNYGELGPMRIPVAHNCVWHYINLFKLDTRPFYMSQPQNLVYIKKRRVQNRPKGDAIQQVIYPLYDLTEEEKGKKYTELLEQGMMDPLLTVSTDERQEILYQLYRYGSRIKHYMRSSVFSVMQQMGLSKGAIDMLGNFSFVLGGYPDSSFSEVFQENYTGDFEYLYEIKGGTYLLIQHFLNGLLLPQNRVSYYYEKNTLPYLGHVHIRKGEIVNSMRYDKNNNKVVVSSWKPKTKQAIKTHYDYVICAAPYSTVRAMDFSPVLTNNRAWGIENIYYQSIQKTILFSKKRFWQAKPFEITAGASLTDLMIQSIWYPQDDIVNPEEPGVLIVYNIGLCANRLGTMDDQRRFYTIKREIEEVHGLPEGSLEDVITDFKTINWKSEQFFQGMCYYNPQQKYLYAPGILAEEYEGHLQFAGVHTSSTHGWMQGGIQTGMQSANAVLQNFLKANPSYIL